MGMGGGGGGGVVGGYIPVSFTGHGSQLEDISDSLTLSHPGSNQWHFSRKNKQQQQPCI